MLQANVRVEQGGKMRVELLFERLAKDPDFRTLLESTNGLPPRELADSLAKEFVQVLARYKSLSDFAREARQLAEAKIPKDFNSVMESEAAAASAASKSEGKLRRPSDPLQVDPIRIGIPELDVLAATRRAKEAASAAREKQNAEELRRQIEMVEEMIQHEIRRDWDTRAGEIRESILKLKGSHQELQAQIKEIEQPPSAPEPEPEEVPPPVVPPKISENDTVYLYGASSVGQEDMHRGEKRNLKGIDERNPIFAIDTEGVRFYLSRVHSDELAVTKSGILLLGKQESIQLRGVHETIVNAIRRNDHIAPFEFGTIIQGRDEFFNKAAPVVRRLTECIQQERNTTTWTVRVMVLDQRISEVVGPSASSQQRERGRDVPGPGRRFDIKTLERILQYERTLAQMVHATLTDRADSTKVGLLIGFGSGTTEDWKPALHATYDLKLENQPAFFSCVCDLQDQYRHLGVMLSVSGNAGRVTLAELANQAISA